MGNNLEIVYFFIIIYGKPHYCTNSELLGNSETAHRLKRYTVLTLPDRPESNPNTSTKIIPKQKKKNEYMSYFTGITYSRASTY
jgi:hypothetical protein